MVPLSEFLRCTHELQLVYPSYYLLDLVNAIFNIRDMENGINALHDIASVKYDGDSEIILTSALPEKSIIDKSRENKELWDLFFQLFGRVKTQKNKGSPSTIPMYQKDDDTDRIYDYFVDKYIQNLEKHANYSSYFDETGRWLTSGKSFFQSKTKKGGISYKYENINPKKEEVWSIAIRSCGKKEAKRIAYYSLFLEEVFQVIVEKDYSIISFIAKSPDAILNHLHKIVDEDQARCILGTPEYEKKTLPYFAEQKEIDPSHDDCIFLIRQGTEEDRKELKKKNMLDLIFDGPNFYKFKTSDFIKKVDLNNLDKDMVVYTSTYQNFKNSLIFNVDCEFTKVKSIDTTTIGTDKVVYVMKKNDPKECKWIRNVIVPLKLVDDEVYEKYNQAFINKQLNPFLRKIIFV